MNDVMRGVLASLGLSIPIWIAIGLLAWLVS